MYTKYVVVTCPDCKQRRAIQFWTTPRRLTQAQSNIVVCCLFCSAERHVRDNIREEIEQCPAKNELTMR